MTREEFERLVTRLERRLGGHPGRLKLELSLCAAFAFGLVFVWIGGLLLAAGACGWFAFSGGWKKSEEGFLFFMLLGLGIVFLVLAVRSLMAMMIRVEAPEGRKLRPEEAPALFALLDDVCQQMGTRQFDEILLTPEFNAAACYTPRLGFLGWARYSLVLGMPLLECLEVAEVKSVIAHEFTHMAGRHGAFSTWIYRQRRIWERLFEKLEARQAGQRYSPRQLFLCVFRWFWPRFHARAFLLSRANEYEADRNAARIAGTREAGLALWRNGAFAERLEEEFWPRLWREAALVASPPGDVLKRLVTCLAVPPEVNDAIRWKERCCGELTGHTNTHPALADRLRSLGLAIRDFALSDFPLGASPSAATALFGSSLEALRSAAQQKWEDDVKAKWTERHAVATQLQGQLERMETHTAGPLSLSPEVLWERAMLLLNVEGESSAEPLLRELIALKPDHAPATLTLGRMLLRRQPEEGEALLSRMLDREDFATESGEMLLQHFMQTGQEDRRREVQRGLDRHERVMEEVAREEAMIRASDAFTTEELQGGDLAPLLEALHAEKITQAWLAKKVIKAMPSRRVFVLVVTSKRGWRDSGAAERDQHSVRYLTRTVKLPGRVLITCPGSALGALAKAVQRKGLALPVAPTA